MWFLCIKIVVQQISKRKNFRKGNAFCSLSLYVVVRHKCHLLFPLMPYDYSIIIYLLQSCGNLVNKLTVFVPNGQGLTPDMGFFKFSSYCHIQISCGVVMLVFGQYLEFLSRDYVQ
jgi:hypothetical protein